VWVPALLVLGRGWTPLGDYAGIELQAYRSLSLHPPLVGMFSTAGLGIGHTVFDPGPLASWLLAIPVHVDPSHGLIWGSALLWGIALSVAIEAMWSAGHWPGCGLIALAVIDLLWGAPSVLENLAWNPYVPIPFLIASMALAFVVGEGDLGWWPALVVTGSIAAQTHLFYVLPAVGLVLVAPLVGLRAGGRPGRLRWLGAGLGVGLLCWVGPLIQSLGAHSNIAALARRTGGVPTLGYGFAFRLLGDSAGPFPVWLTHAPIGFYPDMGFTYDHSATYGAGALFVIIAVTVLAAWTRNRGLFVCAAVTLVTTSAFLVSFAMIPTATLIVVDYLLVAVRVEGVLVWVLAMWCGVSLARTLVAARTGYRPGGMNAALGSAALIVLIAGGSSLGLAAAPEANAQFGTNWSTPEAGEVAGIVSVIEHTVPRGGVTVTLEGSLRDRLRIIAIGEGVGWRLVLDGWHPGLRGILPALSGLPPDPNAPDVAVRITESTAGVVESAER